MSDDLIGPLLLGIKLTREEFSQWLARRRFAVPTFWGTGEPSNALGSSTSSLSEPTVEQPGTRGRPAGTGWKTADEPLLVEMASLVADGTARSPNDAARMMANRALGHGTPESKQTRLAKAYRAKYEDGE
jgi:hypothetical protein